MLPQQCNPASAPSLWMAATARVDGRDHVVSRHVDECGTERAEVRLIEHHQRALRHLAELSGHPAGLHRHSLDGHFVQFGVVGQRPLVLVGDGHGEAEWSGDLPFDPFRPSAAQARDALQEEVQSQRVLRGKSRSARHLRRPAPGRTPPARPPAPHRYGSRWSAPRGRPPPPANPPSTERTCSPASPERASGARRACPEGG